MTGEKRTGGKLAFRPLCDTDTGTVAALERKIFGTPWSEKTVADSIACAAGTGFGGFSEKAAYVALGAFVDGTLSGYLFGTVMAGEGELHRIAVAPDFRQQKIGSALMEEFLHWVSCHGAGGTWLEVRAGNHAAITLYRKYGFLEAGRRRHYYQNPTEDALMFVYH